MTFNQAIIGELKQEAASTEKILQNVPCDKNNWQPHERSMALGNLAAHIADIPHWIHDIITTSEFDYMQRGYKPLIAKESSELVELHKERVAQAIGTLGKTSDEEFAKAWTLKVGAHVVFTLPKAVAIRTLALSHLYHHRGQLSVYLRLLDVYVPGMYGPSKDDTLAQTAQAVN